MSSDPGRVLLLLPNRKDQRALLQAMAGTGCICERASDLQDARLLASARSFDVVVIDYGLPDPQEWQAQRGEYNAFLHEIATMEERPPEVVILSDRREHAELHELFGSSFLRHLVGKRQPLELDELIVTVAKLTRGDIFGIDKYLAYGVVPRTHEVRSSAQKDSLIAEVSAFAGEIGVRRRLTSVLCLVADEFLTNAIFNAPVDANGQRLHASRKRSEVVELGPSARVRFEYACDGQDLILSVRDNFGSLSPATVLSYLARCYAMGDDQIEEKEGGAGMGFFFILEHLNRFIINIDPGRCTELIGFVHISGTYRDFAEQCKSFHIFQA